MKRRLAVVTAALLLGSPWFSRAETVEIAQVSGAIGPATASYIVRAIGHAATTDAQCLIVQLDTPGGLLDSTKEIVQAFYTAPVPTVVYVAPAGAAASSAGCFITLAADVAAMAPNTSMGAAHPVSLSGSSEAPVDPVMQQKLESFAASYMESIATRRKRNVEWAKAAVRESASVTAEQALEKKVIDLIAKDIPDLLQQLDGREVNSKKLVTVSAQVVAVPMLTREKVFQALWRPEIMFLLMLVAIYGILGELSNPGAILPGVAGAIALILVLYMGAVLPIRIAGIALILLAIGLFIADVFAPTHGVLTAGGIISFFLGALMCFDRSEPSFRLSLAYIVPATVLTAAFFIFVVAAGLRAQFLPVKAGRETMLGKTVPALVPIGPQGGKVFVEGEYWNVVSDGPIEAGQAVEIIGIEGLTLKVKPKN
ncbi:MAG TPA: nodulation protein NfeD [Candidatus Paceibacterota bacterium]|nr:nodulation protein NfeD [Candidatus Paceibacterota bacterium]